jgi:hypothetical protein
MMLSNGKETFLLKNIGKLFGFKRVVGTSKLSRIYMNTNQPKQLVILKLAFFFSFIASIIVVDSINYYAAIERRHADAELDHSLKYRPDINNQDKQL